MASSAPLFVHRGDWDDHTRSHACMKWMENLTRAYDAANTQITTKDWYTDDISYVTGDGTEVHGVEQVQALIMQVYSPFQKFTHQPYSIVCWETNDGWEMFGSAKLCAILQGEPSEGEKQVPGQRGDKWDVAIPAAFHFYYKKAPGSKYGILLKRTEIFADTMPAVQILMKRGVIKP